MVEMDNITVFSHNVTAEWKGSPPSTPAACEASNVFMKDFVLVNGSWTSHFNPTLPGFGTWNGTSCNVALLGDNNITSGNSYLFYTYASTCQYAGGPCSSNSNCCSGTCNSLNKCASGGTTQDGDEAVFIQAN
jgi:hypothetical protein